MISEPVGLSGDPSGHRGDAPASHYGATKPRSHEATKPASTGGGDALECMEGLREALHDLGDVSHQGAGRELAQMISVSLGQIMDEHRGMAD
ncbi:MAG: hypothetical protein Q7R41_13085, partial [Phycisphaerales bacterium]|nr:hypothetical protein [Phycisphaerales bacterium]